MVIVHLTIQYQLKGYIMVKVLIYSSKQLYDTAPFEGRAEATIVAYRKDDDYLYEVVKNRTKYYMGNYVTYKSLALDIRLIEQAEEEEELKSNKLVERYKLHPNFELMKI